MRSILLLRAINVGGRNRLAMSTLRSIAAGLGFDDPVTHLQSGNLIADTMRPPQSAAVELERALTDELGLQIAVIGRTPEALDVAVAKAPTEDCHACFLRETPDPIRVKRLLERDFGDDRLEVHGDLVYVAYAGPSHKSKVNNALIERELGVQSTARNMRTVRALSERVRSDRP